MQAKHPRPGMLPWCMQGAPLFCFVSKGREFISVFTSTFGLCICLACRDPARPRFRFHSRIHITLTRLGSSSAPPMNAGGGVVKVVVVMSEKAGWMAGDNPSGGPFVHVSACRIWCWAGRAGINLFLAPIHPFILPWFFFPCGLGLCSGVSPGDERE
jgi:hypothetical protein